MNTRKENYMEYKVQINSLENFKAWSGGLTTLNTVRERNCHMWRYLSDTPTEGQINDWLWFDSDFIYQALGATMICLRLLEMLKKIHQADFLPEHEFLEYVYPLTKAKSDFTTNVQADVQKIFPDSRGFYNYEHACFTLDGHVEHK